MTTTRRSFPEGGGVRRTSAADAHPRDGSQTRERVAFGIFRAALRRFLTAMKTPRPIAAGCLVLVLFVAIAPAHAHTARPVVFDGDWAGDDARALGLLLSDPEFELLAVVATGGACAADVGASNAARLLRFFGRTDVPVAVGSAVARPAPPFRSHATGLAWERLGPAPVPITGFPDFETVWRNVRDQADGRVLYVCSGPLTTLASLLERDPSAAGRIESVVWFGTVPDAPAPDWNARWDTGAVQIVCASGLAVLAVGYPDGAEPPAMTAAWVVEVGQDRTRYGRLIQALFGEGHGAGLAGSGHLRFWDDLVALWLLAPEEFESSPCPGRPRWRIVRPKTPEAVPATVARVAGEAPLHETVIWSRFPSADELLRPDVRQLARAIQQRHGWEEWRLVVLTSELHRHLGTWSILGAKMGLHARERWGVGRDALQVESYAGLRPPLSCVNDGLQVATGASLGRGTIRVADTDAPRCEAVFVHEGRRLRLRLRPDLASAIQRELDELLREHGGLTPSYFEAVRAAALRHWLEMDRHSIFEEAPEPAPHPRP